MMKAIDRHYYALESYTHTNNARFVSAIGLVSKNYILQPSDRET